MSFKTSLLVGTRTLALSPRARVYYTCGLQNYTLAGLGSPCWSVFVLLENIAFLCYHQWSSLESVNQILLHCLIFLEIYTTAISGTFAIKKKTARTKTTVVANLISH